MIQISLLLIFFSHVFQDKGLIIFFFQIQDLIQNEGVGRLLLLASRAADSVGSNTALLAASSISKWIELHAVDVCIFLLRSGQWPRFKTASAKNNKMP